MDICFDSLHDSTRDTFYDVDAVEVQFMKVSGKMTRFYFIYLNNGETHSLKFRDHQLYWIRN